MWFAACWTLQQCRCQSFFRNSGKKHRVRNCPDITILNSLFGLYAFVFLYFCLFVQTSLWSNVWRIWSLKSHSLCQNSKVAVTDWLTEWQVRYRAARAAKKSKMVVCTTWQELTGHRTNRRNGRKVSICTMLHIWVNEWDLGLTDWEGCLPPSPPRSCLVCYSVMHASYCYVCTVRTFENGTQLQKCMDNSPLESKTSVYSRVPCGGGLQKD